jgi:MtrB/PioB family decaheme-associated outer membrane protein
MNTQRKTLWIAMAAASLAMAGNARSQEEYGFEDESAEKSKPVYENYIEIGGGYTEDGNGKFGEYTSGVTDAFLEDGGFPVGSVRLSGGDANTARYWEVNAGVGNGRNLEVSYGVQGNYGLMLYGDRVQKVEFAGARTVYGGASDLMLLPPGYQFTTTYPIPSTPPGSYDPANYSGEEDLGPERQIIGLEGFKRLGDEWTVTLNFENQDKGGDDVFGGNQGFSGTALVPEDIDTEHQRMQARVDYALSCLQQGFEVYLSKFENGNESLAFQNAITPGSYVPNSATGVFRALGINEIATEPDNQYLRIGMDGGYTFGQATRLSWFADWSRGEQDENFLPVVIDTGYYPSINPVFPYSNLDGEVERTDAKLSLSGRPFSRFDYRVQLVYKDRDATHDALQVNELSYNYNTTSPGFSSKVYDKQTTTFAVEGGYRFTGIARLRAGLERQDIDRDTDEWEYFVPAAPDLPFYEPASFTDTTSEDRAWARLTLNPMDALTLQLRAEYSTIDADLSHETEEMAAPPYLPPGATTPVNQLRRATPFFLLDRDQDVLEAELNYDLGHSASVYLRYDLVHSDYDNETLGLDARDSDIWNAGFSWSPVKAVNLSAYVSHEEYEFEQHNRQMNQSGPVPYIDWAMDSEDDIDAAGFSMDWAVIEDRFDLDLDIAYIEADSTVESEFIGTTYPAGTVLPVYGSTPENRDELFRLNIAGVYHWSDRIDLTGRFIYEDREAEDYGWSDEIAAPIFLPGTTTPDPTQESARYMAFAWDHPDYTSKLFVLSMRYKF